MSTATLDSARHDFDALIRKVLNGEEILITEYDKPIARLVPAQSHEERKAEYLRRLSSIRGILKGKAPEFEREPDREL